VNRSRACAAVLSLALVLLAACGGGGSGGGSDGAVTTVTVWDRAGALATSRQQFFAQWNETKGRELGIKVSYEPQATERYEEIVRLGFQTQRAPDIFHSPSSQMGTFVEAGWVQPLDGLVPQEVLDAAAPYLQPGSELVWGGEPYAIPTTSFTNRLVINRDLFRAAGLDPDHPPQTFSEVEAAARAIVSSSGGAAYGYALPVSWVGFRQWIVDVPLLAVDADLTQNGLFNRATSRFETGRYAPVVQHFRTMIQEGLVHPGAATLDYDKMVAAFADGKVGMMRVSSSVAGTFQQLGTKVDVGAGPIPVPDGQQLVRSPMNAGFPYAISALTEHTDAAATVFQVLVGREMQEAVAAGGNPPVDPEVFESAAAKDPVLALFRPTELDKQWPKNPGGVLAVEGGSVDDTIEKLVLDPSVDADAELAALGQRYQTAWDAAVGDGSVDPAEFAP
jgi:multiple sugar transport system substrate-binding protein